MSAPKRGRSPSRSDRSSRRVRIKTADDNFAARFVVVRRDGSALIGRSGATVQRIQRTCGTHCRFESGSRGAQEQVVTVKGTPEQCAHTAEVMIGILLRTKAENKDAELSDDDVAGTPARFEILVHQRQVGRIIGKGGDRIKRFQESSGTKIDIATQPHPLSGPLGPEQLLTLTGVPGAIRGALEAVLAELAKAPPLPVAVDIPSGHAFMMPYRPMPFMGAAAGGASYQNPAFAMMPFGPEMGYWDPRDARFDPRHRDVHGGALDFRDRPRRHASSARDSAGARGSSRGGSSSGRSASRAHSGLEERDSRSSRREKNSERGGIKMAVLSTQVGLLIGRGGAVVQAMARESGARLLFDKTRLQCTDSRAAEVLDGKQSCRITGGLDEVSVALQLVLGKLADGDTTTAPAVDAEGQMSVTLLIPAQTIGWLVGKQGVKIKATEQETGAVVRVYGGRQGALASADGEQLNAVAVVGSERAVLAACTRLTTQLFEQRQARPAPPARG